MGRGVSRAAGAPANIDRTRRVKVEVEGRRSRSRSKVEVSSQAACVKQDPEGTAATLR